MMPQNFETFTNIVNSSPVLTERFSALVQDTISAAREQHGVDLSIEDCTAIAEGSAEAVAAGLQKVNSGKDSVHHERSSDERARRISLARELGLATPPPVQDDLRSRAEKIELLQEVKNPAQRVALARKWDLL